MAKLRRLRDGAVFAIPARCILGRSSSCYLHLENRFASSEHAKIIWTGARWEIRDLGSKNGTFIDGRPVPPGSSARIIAGAELSFAETPPSFQVVDAEAPGLFAVEVTSGTVRSAPGQILVLPDDETPEISIYATQPGGIGWVVEEQDGETRTITDGTIVGAGNQQWRIDLPILVDATPVADIALSMESVFLRFAVSRNEERVEITLIQPGLERRIEPREHGYVLLTLARARSADAERPVAERGWCDRDELLRRLKVDANTLNVAIHRARQQLESAGLEGAAGIIEVRRRQRRFGTDRFEIIPLEH